MSIPQTTKVFRRNLSTNPGTIHQSTEPIPPLSETSVLIRIHAISLNFRDVAMLYGKYPGSVPDNLIPTSDCAGEVVAVGSGVDQVVIGDRVSPIFDLRNIDKPDPEDKVEHLGGFVEGVLREYVAFDQRVLVRVPKHLSWEEAACIPCAGTTAWNAMEMGGPIKRKSALLLGTGGVSMFALLICLAAGIKPIITSSSDQKLSDAASLGPDGAVDTINYRTHPDWEKEVLRLTNGRGVDVVLENVGGSGIKKSITSMARKGVIYWIGFLGGMEFDHFAEAMGDFFRKIGTLRTIQVGSKVDQDNLCRFLEEKQVSMKSIVGKTFTFDDSPAAFDYLYSGQHMGKVVIKV